MMSGMMRMTMMRTKYRCCNCGCECGIHAVEEPRGEFWGFPCSETMYYSDCCDDDFEEVEEEEDD